MDNVLHPSFQIQSRFTEECEEEEKKTERKVSAIASEPSGAKTFSSRLNVLRGSSPTVTTKSISSHSGSTNASSKVDHTFFDASDSDEKSEVSINWDSDSTWPDIDIPGSWGTHGLETDPWNDEENPCVSFRKYDEVNLNEIEKRGVLTDRIIAAGSSYLDKSPEFGKYVFCKVDLSNKLLTDICILTYHHYLQYVNLRKNELTEVKALGQLPFLMYLDVSGNFLTKVLDFKPPFNLTYVNYANNKIQAIDDLSDFWSIVHLDLSSNRIEKIRGVQGLKYLRHLNLAHNRITTIENLSHMKLLTLSLQNNVITKFERGENLGFKTLEDILYVDVGHNYLSSLRLFHGASNLQSINAENNNIDDLSELTYLSELNFLTEANFEGNPIFTMKYYLENCILNIKHIYVLDRMFMDATKKAVVLQSFNSFPHMDATRQAARLLFLQQINDPMLGSFIIPSDEPPPPFIILVGPPGSNKGEIVRQLCTNHPKYTVLGVSHTTRPMNDTDVEGRTYYFVSHDNFKNMLKDGKFIAVANSFGHSYGLAETEISKTVEKKVALVLHMDLPSALALRAKGYRCHLILAIPSTPELHKTWFSEKYYNHCLIPKYYGAVEIQNEPIKAKMFADFHKYGSRSAMCVARDILNDIIDEVVEPPEDGLISDSSEDISLASNYPSGILKTPSAIAMTKSDCCDQRPSVAFNKKCEEPRPPAEKKCSPQALRLRNQSSRSVTFCNTPSMDASLTVQSVSQGLLPIEGEESSPPIFSVLSVPQLNPKQSTSNESPEVWEMQLNANETVIKEVLKMRESYLEVHQTNPGLFTEVLFTDNTKSVYSKLKNLLKDCINNQSKEKPYYTFKKDSVYQTVIATRLQLLHKEIKSHMSVTQNQLDTMAKEHSLQPLRSDLKSSQGHAVEVMRKYHHQAVSYKLPAETERVMKKPSKDSLESDDSY